MYPRHEGSVVLLSIVILLLISFTAARVFH